MVGKKAIIDLVALNGYPNWSIGRPMKIGKENIIGCLAAIERYVRLDHGAMRAEWERSLKLLQDQLAGLPGVSVELLWPGEAGELVPWGLVVVEPGAARLTPDGLAGALWDSDPRIAVGPTPRGITVYPATMKAGEMATVTKRLVQLLQ